MLRHGHAARWFARDGGGLVIRPRRVYTDKTFGADAERTIGRANAIIDEYAAQGFDLTLRQLYYQFVARGWLANRQTEYKRLGSIINDARLAGRIDWEAIVDRTRNLRKLAAWDTPEELIAQAARQYRNDLWRSQPLRVEVWIEKDALVGVIEGVCNEYGAPHFSCRGYTSQSEMWAAAQRLGEYIEAGQRVLILHLGDHDPSGVDMSRDIEERLLHFLVIDYYRAHVGDFASTRAAGDPVTVDLILHDMMLHTGGNGPAFELRRIALTYEQVEQYGPPPNPAKITDSRSGAYIAEHGDESWELDALDPATLDGLIRTELENEIEREPWDEAEAAQETGTTLLTAASRRWADVAAMLAPEEREPME